MKYYGTFTHYRDAWDNAPYFDPPIPLNLDIELSTVCNLRCPFCFTTDTEFKQKKYKLYMDKALALRLIDEADAMGIPALKFNWRGESTIHQHFTEIIKYANKKKSFYEIIVNTNGNIPDNALKGLMYATKVLVSVDSFDSKIYKKMRKGGDIRTVLNTISSLVTKEHPNVWVRRIITKDNKKEEFAFIAKSMYLDKVNVSEHYCFDRNKKSKHQVSDRITKRIYCAYPSQRLVVATDGLVFPCCVDYNETMPVGNVINESLNDIWRSQKMYEIRNALRNKNILPWMKQCEDCTSWMAYDSVERQFVQDRNYNGES